MTPDGDSLCCRIDFFRFFVYADVDANCCGKLSVGLQRQCAAVGDGASDIVRQSAVGIGNETAAFDDDDFGIFVEVFSDGLPLWLLLPHRQ